MRTQKYIMLALLAAALLSGTAILSAQSSSPQGASSPGSSGGVVSWVHVGDLHITTADQQSYADFKTIISNTNQYLKGGINFMYLPGDNANDGTESEYQLIKQATDQLKVPLYAIAGDHDHKGIDLFGKYMEPRLYQSFSVGGYHFALLDVMSGISSEERTWLTNDLEAATKAGLRNVVFMHTYNLASSMQELIQKDNVILVDTGHTHTNQLANDGHTVYAATRSTGQASEGPVGFSLVNLDNGVVSWKFKPLGSWPFVMITSPADKQLMIDPSQVVKGTVDVRAKIWDDKSVATATMQIDGGTAVPLQRIGDTQIWSAKFDSTKVSGGDHTITVSVTDAGGNTSSDAISVVANQTSSVQAAQLAFGPSGNFIGAQAEKGLLGIQSSVAHNPKGGPRAAPNGPEGRKGPPMDNLAGATIQSISGNLLTVGLKDGNTRVVQVTSATRIIKEVSGSVSDLKTGTTIDLRTQAAGVPSSGSSGTPTPSANAPVTVAQIDIHAAGDTNGGSAPPRAPKGRKGLSMGNLAGATIQSIEGNLLTAKSHDGTTQQVQVTGATRIIKELSGSMGDLKAGMTIDLRTQAAGAPGSGGSGTPAPNASIPVIAAQIDIQT